MVIYLALITLIRQRKVEKNKMFSLEENFLKGKNISKISFALFWVYLFPAFPTNYTRKQCKRKTISYFILCNFYYSFFFLLYFFPFFFFFFARFSKVHYKIPCSSSRYSAIKFSCCQACAEKFRKHFVWKPSYYLFCIYRTFSPRCLINWKNCSLFSDTLNHYKARYVYNYMWFTFY